MLEANPYLQRLKYRRRKYVIDNEVHRYLCNHILEGRTYDIGLSVGCAEMNPKLAAVRSHREGEKGVESLMS